VVLFWISHLENWSGQLLPKRREFSAGIHLVNWIMLKPREFFVGIGKLSGTLEKSRLESNFATSRSSVVDVFALPRGSGRIPATPVRVLPMLVRSRAALADS
jgi:hypothetical protein